MKILKITWDDHGSFTHDEDKVWHSLEEVKLSYAKANFLQTSVGYKVFENKNDLIIAQSCDEQDGVYNFGGLLRIIKINIVDIIEL
jgi:hypothetical protein